MLGRMPKTLVLGLFVFTLACCTALAQSTPAVAHTSHTGVIVPAEQTPAAVTIFTNLGPTATDEYNDATGYYVLGPDNTVGLSEQWIGLPFTPKQSGHVTQMQVAVQIDDTTTTNRFVVGLYSDNAGTVGTLLASASAKNAPDFGTCCTLVNVAIPSTAVTAGTQYWVVVSTDDVHAANFTGVWAASNLDNIAGDVAQGGWSTFSANVPAAAVKGTVP